jgi:Mlc titration factor MtfA (ptsG expression regulator)
MVVVIQILLVLLLIILIILFAFLIKRKKEFTSLPENYTELFYDYVKFYRHLSEEEKLKFEERAAHFLSSVKITGTNAEVEDLDIILIASAAIIPVFRIPDWHYINLHEVLYYPGNFNEDFDQAGTDRFIAGMVGTGALQNVMILTKWHVRHGFINNNSNHNTAIHEFVHLVDKMDGTFDGIPEIILERKYTSQWQQLMNTTIEQMRRHGSDIPMYGATNTVEFFAVISEYFFEQPLMLKNHHPQVYEMLCRIYRTELMYN